MKLSEFKNRLTGFETINFQLPNGDMVPPHYHVTEVGIITKDFMDCGGIVRSEKVVTMQLWSSDDVTHRLKPQKLLNIISLSERKLSMGDYDVEVEYQAGTIGKYGITFAGNQFSLVNKSTACLAFDNCGITTPVESACCSPAEECCS